MGLSAGLAWGSRSWDGGLCTLPHLVARVIAWNDLDWDKQPISIQTCQRHLHANIRGLEAPSSFHCLNSTFSCTSLLTPSCIHNAGLWHKHTYLFNCSKMRTHTLKVVRASVFRRGWWALPVSDGHIIYYTVETASHDAFRCRAPGSFIIQCDRSPSSAPSDLTGDLRPYPS